jgi:hypothetical protein
VLGKGPRCRINHGWIDLNISSCYGVISKITPQPSPRQSLRLPPNCRLRMHRARCKSGRDLKGPLATPLTKRSVACVNFANDMTLFRFGESAKLSTVAILRLLCCPRLFCYADVKTNSTLLQSAPRADFPFAIS